MSDQAPPGAQTTPGSPQEQSTAPDGPDRKPAGSPSPSESEIQLDPSIAAQFIAEIREIVLSDALEREIRGYERVGHRAAFLWRWVRRGVEITTLSCVHKALWDHVCDTKSLGVMFDVLLDDVADESEDAAYLEKLIGITGERRPYLGNLSPKEREYYLFSRHIWEQIWSRLATYPRFDEFREILLYDYRQLMNSMRYSMLIRQQPAILNVPEHDAYLPHNMHMVISGTIDCMASPDFDLRSLGRLRSVLLHAQYMGRIGNLVTTWEREIGERDFSSGVFPVALSMGALTLEDLDEGDTMTIAEKLGGAEIERLVLRK